MKAVDPSFCYPEVVKKRYEKVTIIIFLAYKVLYTKVFE